MAIGAIAGAGPPHNAPAAMRLLRIEDKDWDAPI
jgi:hypothetical protein